MSILLFRKRGTAGRLKANQHGYRPRQASPVNCAWWVEQNNKKTSGPYFIDRWRFGYFQIWKGAKEKAFRLTWRVHCVSAQTVCDSPRLLEGQKLRLCHPSHLSAKTFNRVGGITEPSLIKFLQPPPTRGAHESILICDYTYECFLFKAN